MGRILDRQAHLEAEVGNVAVVPDQHLAVARKAEPASVMNHIQGDELPECAPCLRIQACGIGAIKGVEIGILHPATTDAAA